MEATRDTLIDRLQNAGYFNAVVFKRYRIPRDSARVAHAGFDLAPGSRMYFGDPVIQNNQKVSTRVIRRMLAFRRGDTYSRAAVLRSQRNLFGLEMFRSIDIRTDLDAAGDTITPHVLVEEGDLTRVRPGVGLNTAEYINTELRWTGRNFFGGARRFEIRARLANIFARQLEQTPGFEETGGPPFDKFELLFHRGRHPTLVLRPEQQPGSWPVRGTAQPGHGVSAHVLRRILRRDARPGSEHQRRPDLPARAELPGRGR